MLRSGTFGEEKQSFDQNLSGVEGQGFDWNPPEPVGGKSLQKFRPFRKLAASAKLDGGPSQGYNEVGQIPPCVPRRQRHKKWYEKGRTTPAADGPSKPEKTASKNESPTNSPKKQRAATAKKVHSVCDGEIGSRSVLRAQVIDNWGVRCFGLRPLNMAQFAILSVRGIP